MDINALSSRYRAAKLHERDADAVLMLYQTNPQYFSLTQNAATRQSAADDLTALPPGKEAADKYFLGFYDDDELVAVMDLILGYPDNCTAYIGLFMVLGSRQGKGAGTEILSQTLRCLRLLGFASTRLGVLKTNHQGMSFWKKNGFLFTGTEKKQETYTIVLMEKKL